MVYGNGMDNVVQKKLNMRKQNFNNEDFDSKQFIHFKQVEEQRFFWMTENPFVVDKEKEMLGLINIKESSKVLEVGSGEGANIFNMRHTGVVLGMDYSLRRLIFSKEKLRFKQINAEFVCGKAEQIPFQGGKFDVVFTKDLLHHLTDKKEVISEMARVCKKNGTLAIIEMNGSSNLIGKIFATLVKEENGMKSFSVKEAVTFLSYNGGVDIRVVMKQAFLLYRVIFHYKLCFSGFARFRAVKYFFNFMETLGSYVIPKTQWGYIIILARKS